jgi:hypothetical protein
MDIPDITPEEEKPLSIVIEDWATRSPLQRGIAIAVWRGYDTPEKAAAYLNVPVEVIRKTLPSVWGLLLDHNTDKIWIK